MNLTENFPLSKLTTFGIGGPARYFVEVHDLAEMREAFSKSKELQLPTFILGRGSNCLFDDKGLTALVILNKISHINKSDSGLFQVGSGYHFSRLGTVTAREGWSGLEFASGIPGSVGGAVFMNAGANGQETKDFLTKVTFLTLDGELKHFCRDELQFSYRHSPFHEMKGAIIEAHFQLSSSSTAREKQVSIIDYRKNTQPYGDKSAGCIFRNPTGDHAGALIEKAGLKGFSVGGARVSEQHANFIVNEEGASAVEVLELIKKIQEEIKATFNIELQPEVRYISNEKVQI